jgi:N-acylneuraminate cytidylyltransferase
LNLPSNKIGGAFLGIKKNKYFYKDIILQMKTITIIPARGKSKRLPNKNILSLGGIPLIAHSILYAQQNNDIIDEIYVSTDDATIKKIALHYGAKVIDRPESLSGDFEPTVSALKHVLESIADEVENVILLQATNPLRPENLSKEAFETYQNENKDSLFTVSRNDQKLGKIEANKFIPFNYEIGQRSQDLEPLYFENGLLYISKAKLILEGKIISESAFPYEVNSVFANVDIDIQADLDYAEYLFNKFIIHNS